MTECALFCVKCRKKIKNLFIYLFIIYLGFAPGAFAAP